MAILLKDIKGEKWSKYDVICLTNKYGLTVQEYCSSNYQSSVIVNEEHFDVKEIARELNKKLKKCRIKDFNCGEVFFGNRCDN